jgi:hypothetical protein
MHLPSIHTVIFNVYPKLSAYSGQYEGYMNPMMQCVVNTGPLPATVYKLATCQDLMHTSTIRPCSFYLEPQDES